MLANETVVTWNTTLYILGVNITLLQATKAMRGIRFIAITFP
jgi:hypothetical protein